MSRRSKGEGSITFNTSKKRWQGSYKLPDGKRAYVYGDTQAQVTRRLAELRRKVNAGLDVMNARVSLSVFLAHWLEENRANWQPKTYTHNEVVCRLHIVPHIGMVALDRVDVPTVQRWLRKLRSATTSTDLPARALKVLRAALNAGVHWRLIDYNPAALVKAPRHTPQRGLALSATQTARLLEEVEPHRLKALYHLALVLGLRRGELIALRWADIDVQAGTLTIQDGKTAAAKRTLPLDIGTPRLTAILHEHWQRQLAERTALSLTWQEHGLVFPSEIGTPLLARNLYRHFKSVLKRANLPDVRFHDLRHTALTRLAENGAPPAVVQAIAGHTTPALALQVYTHANLDALRSAFG